MTGSTNLKPTHRRSPMAVGRAFWVAALSGCLLCPQAVVAQSSLPAAGAGSAIR
jgi:hypothetical protein